MKRKQDILNVKENVNELIISYLLGMNATMFNSLVDETNRRLKAAEDSTVKERIEKNLKNERSKA